MQRTKILVIGSLNVDLVIQGPRLPEEGRDDHGPLSAAISGAKERIKR